jgi:hypothetical protein
VSVAPSNSGVVAPGPGANAVLPRDVLQRAMRRYYTATLGARHWLPQWRLISSLVLWAIMLAVVFWLPPTAMYIFMNVVIARAVWEFYKICEAKGLPSYKVWGVIGTVAHGFGKLVCVWHETISVDRRFRGVVV